MAKLPTSTSFPAINPTTIYPEQLKAALNISSTLTPDRASEMYNLVQSTGLPTSTVFSNFDEVKQKQSVKDINHVHLIDTHPKTAKVLSDPILAGANSDNHEQLKAYEGLSEFDRMGKDISSQFKRDKLNVQLQDLYIKDSDEAFGGKAMQPEERALLEKLSTESNAIPNYSLPVPDIKLYPDTVGQGELMPDPYGLNDGMTTGDMYAMAKSTSDFIRATPPTALNAPGYAAGSIVTAGNAMLNTAEQVGGLAAGTYGAVRLGGKYLKKLPIIGDFIDSTSHKAALYAAKKVAGKAVGTVAIYEFAKAQYGQDYPQNLQITDVNGKPIDKRIAAGIAAVTSAMSGVLEKTGLSIVFGGFNPKEIAKSFTKEGMENLLKTNPSVAKLLTDTFIHTGESMGGEGFTEMFEQILSDVGTETAKASGNFLTNNQYHPFDVDPNATPEVQQAQFWGWAANKWQNAKAAGIAGASAGGVMGSFGPTFKAVNNVVVRKFAANREQNTIQKIIDTAANDPTIDRNYDLYKEATKDTTGATNVYIRAKDFMGLFQADQSDENTIKTEEQNLADAETNLGQPAKPQKPSLQEFIKYVPGVEDQLDEAMALNANLVLPANEVAAAMVKVPGALNLKEFMALRPETLHERGISNKDIQDSLSEAYIQEEAAKEKSYFDIFEEGEAKKYMHQGSGIRDAEYIAKGERAKFETLIERLKIENTPRALKTIEMWKEEMSKLKVTIEQPSYKPRPQKIDKLDLHIDKIRNYKPEGSKSPIINYLTKNGKVKVGSPLHQEIERYAPRKKYYYLYSNKGKFTDGDNIVASEMRDQLKLDDVPAIENGYVSPDWLYDSLRNETFGKSLKSSSATAEEQEVENWDRELDYYGINPAQETAEIKRQLLEARRTEDRAIQLDTSSQGLFQFAGQESKTALVDKLDKAKILIEDNSSEEVRKQTGWFIGMDGKWRYEISDDTAKLKEDYDGFLKKLGEVLDHKDLFDAYPDLKNVRVRLSLGHPKLEGEYNNLLSQITIKANNEKELLSGLLHEIQHVIQEKEGFATGGGAEPTSMHVDKTFKAKFAEQVHNVMEQYNRIPREIIKPIRKIIRKELGGSIGLTNLYYLSEKTEDALESLEEISNKLPNEYSTFKTEVDKLLEIAGLHLAESPEQTNKRYIEGYQRYTRLAGEIEARNTQKRQGLTSNERVNVSPYTTQDIPSEEAIIIFNGKEIKYNLDPEGSLFQQSLLPQTETQAFKEWFDDSKVVDSEGKPLVVYHGTAADFEVFDYTKKDNGGAPVYGKGYYFAVDPKLANQFASTATLAGGNIIPVYLSIKNPYISESNEFRVKFSGVEKGEIINILTRQGYDGIYITRNNNPKHSEYIAFKPTQIKSIHNEGTWDKNNANILFQLDTNKIYGQYMRDELGVPNIDLFLNYNRTTPLEEHTHHWLDAFMRITQKLGDDVPKAMQAQIDSMFSWFDRDAANIYASAKKYTPFMTRKVDDKYIVQNRYTKEKKEFADKAQANIYAKEGNDKALEAFKKKDVDYVRTRLKKHKANSELDYGKGNITDRMITVAIHEHFAAGAMKYFERGEAPSIELRDLFQTFKIWIIRTWKEIKGLIPEHIKLDKEAIEMFDRMYATDEQIETLKNNPLFKEDTTIVSMLTKAEAEDYRKKRADQKLANKDDLFRKALKQYTNIKKAEASKIYEGVKKEVTERVGQAAIYKAVHFLKTGKMLDGKEGVTAVKLERKAIRERFDKEILKYLPANVTATEGISPEVAAEMFGFDNAQSLLDNLMNYGKAIPTYEEALTTAIDETMVERYGDMMRDGTIEREALNVANNEEQATIALYELEVLLRQLTDQVVITKDQFKLRAKEILSAKSLSKIVPSHYYRAEVASAREAGKAIAKKDWKKAAEHKRAQILNQYLYAMAKSFKAEEKKTYQLFSKVLEPDAKLYKTRDINFVNGARAILSKYDIKKSKHNLDQIMRQIQSYEPEVYEKLIAAKEELQIPAKSYKDFTFDELLDVKNAVENLWELSKENQMILVKGKKMRMDEARQLLIAQLTKVYGTKASSKVKSTTQDTERDMKNLISTFTALRKAESWFSEMDGDDIDGVFMTTSHRPIREGVDEYKLNLEKYIGKFAAVFDAYQDGSNKADLNREYNAPELVDEEGVNHLFKSKFELLHALLHTGNYDNKFKLIKGYGYARRTLGGEWDLSAWDRFRERMIKEGVITKREMDFVQALFDLFEEIKPLAQKAHKEMYGYYFKEVIAEKIKTPWGTYRGGYAPAIIDRGLVKGAEKDKIDVQDLINNTSTTILYPSVENGFTKPRVAGYAQPLKLDIRVIGNHIDKVLRLSHLGKPVSDVSRLYMRGALRDHLDQINPGIVKNIIKPWLQRTATQLTDTPTSYPTTDQFFRKLRTKSGIAYMILNFVNALQQYPGIAVAGAMVDKSRLAENAIAYKLNPLQFAEFVNNKSTFMKLQAKNLTFGLLDDVNGLVRPKNKYQEVKKFIAQNGYILQRLVQNMVNKIVWQAAYEQSLENGKADESAVAWADSVVRQTQGSFDPEDLSALEASTPFVKLFTQFMGYFTTLLNLQISQARQIIRKSGFRGSAKLFNLYFCTIAVPAIVTQALVMTLRDEWDDKDKKGQPSKLARLLLYSQINYTASELPVVGQVGNAFVNAYDNKFYNDNMNFSPALSMSESAIKGIVSSYKAINGGKYNGRDVKDMANAISLITGIQASAVARPAAYLTDVYKHKERPSGPVDFTRGLLTGAGNKDR